MCKATTTRNNSYSLNIFVMPTLKKIKKKTPYTQSKSVAANPCNHRFAATHLLSLLTHLIIESNYGILCMKDFFINKMISFSYN